MANKNNDKKNDDFYKGLSFKQFKNIGKIPIEENDISWAGRLFSKSNFWFNKLTLSILVMFAITIISVFAIWVSILLRNPPLLLGVYPNGEIVCFPKILNRHGRVEKLSSAYVETCKNLNKKKNVKWQLNNLKKESNKNAIFSEKEIVYNKIAITEYDKYLNNIKTIKTNKGVSKK